MIILEAAIKACRKVGKLQSFTGLLISLVCRYDILFFIILLFVFIRLLSKVDAGVPVGGIFVTKTY